MVAPFNLSGLVTIEHLLILNIVNNYTTTHIQKGRGKPDHNEWRGKKVYIDTFASWCRPWKSEFKFTKELTELLESKNIASLYISLDQKSETLNCKDIIRFYSLKGHHILAAKQLAEDVHKW
ncbi:MAG: hypothetical protein ABSF81_05060 [Bacteroidales bacterium]|jgi:hypothetical protein